ncbi:hypothetical protein ASPFODRAFT_50546 [Aspergillus luchuensis CBS 106.47]|uniref:Uncharacterized protein n=1 Tax=Aspergillus luchuensis (strain CBS 106.47) TaxID=1137211 RepID=A0A1M3T7I7_ASPLC|nr:hypothetical protein ASPFODRAFT_50546 [Aspergillus luchuensis CBS 106.47]
MTVSHPRTTDYQIIIDTGVSCRFPRAVTAAMSALIVRIELTSLGETVNQHPASGLDPSKCDRDAVLDFDAQFQDKWRDLPDFFQMA